MLLHRFTRFSLLYNFSHKTTLHQSNMCDVSAVSSSPPLSLSVSPVSCSICGFRQVSSQPVGGRNILGTDRPVGQPQSPSDPRPEDSSVSSCSHCKAASTVNMTHSYSPIQHTVSRDLTATHITPQWFQYTGDKMMKSFIKAFSSFEVLS